MFEHLQENYDAHIATAAKRYKRAVFACALERLEDTRIERAKAQEYLFWLIEAKQEGWNLSDFESEFE